MAVLTALRSLDRRLLAWPVWAKALIVALTVVNIVRISLPLVPRQGIDFRQVPLLSGISQEEMYGTDTLSDLYGARVILNDVTDMYTKARLEQTPQEAAQWTREASAPYPPVVLLTEAALYAIGEQIGVGFYGMILSLACLFISLSLWYFLQTRWYLFPLLYANFTWIGYRFVHVQDSTYLVMLVTVMVALLLARAGRSACHILMAVAITMKLSPFYYAKNVLDMPRRLAISFVAMLVAGLVLPYFIWDNYLYIYRYGNELKGSWQEAAGAVIISVPYAIGLWYTESRLRSDWEDRVGWGLVPFAMFLGLKTNAARHLLIVLLVPDKRGWRNTAAIVALGIPALLPSIVRFNSSLWIATGVLIGILICRVWQVRRAEFGGRSSPPAAQQNF